MSTFADHVRDKALEIERLLLDLRTEIKEVRPSVHDVAAQQVLTRLQARMMTIGVDVQQLKCSVSTAITVGEFRGRDLLPWMKDGKMAAAGDDTLLKEEQN